MNYDYTIVESFVTFSVVRREVQKADMDLPIFVGKCYFACMRPFRLTLSNSSRLSQPSAE